MCAPLVVNAIEFLVGLFMARIVLKQSKVLLWIPHKVCQLDVRVKIYTKMYLDMYALVCNSQLLLHLQV